VPYQLLSTIRKRTVDEHSIHSTPCMGVQCFCTWKIRFSFSYNYNCNCNYKNYNYSWDIWRWSKLEAQLGASNCLFEAVKTPACLCRFFRKRTHSLFSACKGEENQEEKKQREMTTRDSDLERLKPIQDPDKNIKNIITKGRVSNSSSENSKTTGED